MTTDYDIAFELFDGIPTGELAPFLSHLEQRTIPPGAEILYQGDQPREMYLIQRGIAEVLVQDATGTEHRVAALGSGAAVGEISLFTGEPVTATVRAAADHPLDVLVVGPAQFERLARAFPLIYRNLGVILAARLRRTNRLAVESQTRRITVLHDHGAPPLLGYALAASIAWHTQASVLLLVLSATARAEELAALGTRMEGVTTTTSLALALAERAGGSPRVALLLAEPTGALAPENLAGSLDELASDFGHVLVQLPPDVSIPASEARVVHLTEARTPRPAMIEADRSLVVSGWDAEPADVPQVLRDRTLTVPAPTREDQRLLQASVLPTRTPLGRAIGGAARDIAGLKVGVALGAGAIRGYAHIGVLKIFEREGVPVDGIAGSSVGAGLAAGYAVGKSPDELATDTDFIGSHTIRATVPTKSLLSSAGMRKAIQQIFGDARIETTRVPLAITGTDLHGAREVVFRRGLIWSAALASMSMPGVYPVQRIGDLLLVDGGVLDPVPARIVAEQLGADVVLGVKLYGRRPATDEEREALPTANAEGTIVQAMLKVYETVQHNAGWDSAQAATVMIEPRFHGASATQLRNFTEGRRFIAAGQEAAEAALPRLRAVLPWLRAQPL